MLHSRSIPALLLALNAYVTSAHANDTNRLGQDYRDALQAIDHIRSTDPRDLLANAADLARLADACRACNAYMPSPAATIAADAADVLTLYVDTVRGLPARSVPLSGGKRLSLADRIARHACHDAADWSYCCDDSDAGSYIVASGDPSNRLHG